MKRTVGAGLAALALTVGCSTATPPAAAPQAAAPSATSALGSTAPTTAAPTAVTVTVETTTVSTAKAKSQDDGTVAACREAYNALHEGAFSVSAALDKMDQSGGVVAVALSSAISDWREVDGRSANRSVARAIDRLNRQIADMNAVIFTKWVKQQPHDLYDAYQNLRLQCSISGYDWPKS